MKFEDPLKYLESVAKAMEETLQEHENSSWILGICFILLGGAAIGSYFFYSLITGSAVLPVILSLITGFILFIVFGLIVGRVNNRTLEKIYNDDIKNRINEYLENMQINRYEFDFIANQSLSKKSLLRRFLFRA